MIKNLISYIVFRLVQNPECVEVTTENRNNYVLVSIKVDSFDKGKILGVGGGVIKSIKTLISAISSKKVKITIGE